MTTNTNTLTKPLYSGKQQFAKFLENYQKSLCVCVHACVQVYVRASANTCAHACMCVWVSMCGGTICQVSVNNIWNIQDVECDAKILHFWFVLFGDFNCWLAETWPDFLSSLNTSCGWARSSSVGPNPASKTKTQPILSAQPFFMNQAKVTAATVFMSIYVWYRNRNPYLIYQLRLPIITNLFRQVSWIICNYWLNLDQNFM